MDKRSNVIDLMSAVAKLTQKCVNEGYIIQCLDSADDILECVKKQFDSDNPDADCILAELNIIRKCVSDLKQVIKNYTDNLELHKYKLELFFSRSKKITYFISSLVNIDDCSSEDEFLDRLESRGILPNGDKHNVYSITRITDEEYKEKTGDYE